MKQLLLLFTLALGSCAQAPSADNMPQDPKAMPPIVLLRGDTVSKFSTDSLAAGRPTLLYFYGPGCLPCDTMSRTMVGAMDSLRDVNILFLSAGSFHEVKVYQEKYDVEKYPNVQLGLDYNNAFIRYYGGAGFPLLIFYDRDRQIKRAHYGVMPLDTVRAIIEK